MKKYINKISIIGIIGIIFFTSCEKEIEVDLPDYESKIVVEGSIEPNQYAVVMITKSADYFAVYNQETFLNMLVTDAIVTVTNQSGVIDTLVFQPVSGQPFPFAYSGTKIKGVTGGNYTLTVTTGGKTYQSTTSILPSVPIDSLMFKMQDETDSTGIIRYKFTDPAGVNNFYRVFAKRLQKDSSFIPVLGATFDDRLIDGITTYADIYKGDNTNIMQQNEEENNSFAKNHSFKVGDIVVVKSCSIDFSTYKFWYSAEKEISSGGNPFTSPSPVISNIEGALGIWGSYGPRYDTIVIVK